MSFELVLIIILGLVWGSFANVYIYRWPLEKSVVRPRSSCPSCQKMIAWYDNIPVLSWLLLKGRCRHCSAKISFRYPLVEILCALLFVFAYLRLGPSWWLLEVLVFFWALLVCSFIDLDHMLLPDQLTLSGIVIGLIGAALNPEREFLASLFGVLMGGGFLWFMAWLYYALTGRDGMGGGDIKLIAWIGAVLGFKAIPFVIIFSAVVGSVIGLALTFKSKEGLKAAIPFGPFLAVAAIFHVLAGQTLAQEYWAIFMPF